MEKPLKLTVEEIDAARSPKGGFTAATLAQWGVPWPPPAGWRQALIDGLPIPSEKPAYSPERLPATPEAIALQKLVMAVINSGQGHILSTVPELRQFELPTVADFRGSSFRFDVTGEARLDDRVYRFWCLRDLQDAAA